LAGQSLRSETDTKTLCRAGWKAWRRHFRRRHTKAGPMV
jgi:hypothetical protein